MSGICLVLLWLLGILFYILIGLWILGYYESNVRWFVTANIPGGVAVIFGFLVWPVLLLISLGNWVKRKIATGRKVDNRAVIIDHFHRKVILFGEAHSPQRSRPSNIQWEVDKL